MTVFVDLTEFFTRPLRTGIQRVGGELCRHWPADSELVPAMFHEGRLVRLPEGMRDTIAAYFARDGGRPEAAESIRRTAAEAARQGSPVEVREHRVLVPEVFYDAGRTAFYRSLGSREMDHVYFLIFDLLPLTHPEFFDPHVPAEAIDRYFRVIRGARHVAFISEATRAAYYERLLRRPVGDGPVLRLGSDSLGPRNAARKDGVIPPPHFAALGTIEPRKRQSLILDAFEPLLRERPDVRLTFIGRAGWAAGDVIARIRRLACELPEQFVWIQDCDDPSVLEVLFSCRATVFVSAAEGFGLPAVESLWAGVPVIAIPGIPSLENVTAGVMARQNVADAAYAFCDDGSWNEVAKQAAAATLPTWRTFGTAAMTWVQISEGENRPALPISSPGLHTN